MVGTLEAEPYASGFCFLGLDQVRLHLRVAESGENDAV